MMTLEWSMCSVSLLLLVAVSKVRLECSDGQLFLTNCNSVQRLNFLLYDSPQGEDVRCRNTDTEYSWSLSADGTERARQPLSPTSNRYIINGGELTLTWNGNVTGEDGGLYRCGYTNGGLTPELCVTVYERAVFESCPSTYEGTCSGETPLSVTAGESAVFNATVMYTPGGSCDFQQSLRRITLWRINELNGVANDQLYSCSVGSDDLCTTTSSDPRVSLSRGRKPGLEFAFTMNDTQTTDASLYEVVVVRQDPTVGDDSSITKRFRLQVNAAPPTPEMATTAVRTTAESTTLANNENLGEVSSGAVAAGVVVPLLVIILVVLIVFGFLVLLLRRRQQGPSSSSLLPSNLYKPPRVQQAGMAKDSPAVTMTDSYSRTGSLKIVSHTEVQAVGSVPNVINFEENVVVSLPPENPRTSFVDSDMHELPSRLRCGSLVIRDQPIPEQTLESRNVPV